MVAIWSSIFCRLLVHRSLSAANTGEASSAALRNSPVIAGTLHVNLLGWEGLRIRGLFAWTAADARGSDGCCGRWPVRRQGQLLPVCRSRLGSQRPGSGHPVHQVHQAVIVDAAMLAQADFTGAAGWRCLRCSTARRPLGCAVNVRSVRGVVKPLSPANPQQWMPSGITTSLLQRRARSIRAWLSPRCWVTAGHVHGNRCVLRGEFQLVHQVGADEAHRVIQVQARVP